MPHKDSTGNAQCFLSLIFIRKHNIGRRIKLTVNANNLKMQCDVPVRSREFRAGRAI